MYFYKLFITFIYILNFSPPLKNDVHGTTCSKNTLHGSLTHAGVPAQKQHFPPFPRSALSGDSRSEDLSSATIVHAVQSRVRLPGVVVRPSSSFAPGLIATLKYFASLSGPCDTRFVIILYLNFLV